jgi:hypothetical protein
VSDEQWEAEITPGGRWTWYIQYRCGLTCIATEWRGLALGSRQHAEAKARRALAHLRRRDERMADSTVIS